MSLIEEFEDIRKAIVNEGIDISLTVADEKEGTYMLTISEKGRMTQTYIVKTLNEVASNFEKYIEGGIRR